MEKFWFFNSAPGDPRVYQAQDFANYFGLVLTSGILAVNNQMGLQVKADGTDMRVYVEPGKAIIKGNAYENTANEYLTVDLPEATENRIDRIVLRHDLTNANRHIKVFVKRGTASAPPDLQRDNFVYEISLARVLLEANTSTIDPLNITDERMDENLAGIVHSMITVPTSQFQEQWDEWFNTNVPAYEQEWQNFMDTITGQSPVMSVNGTTPDANGNVEVAVDTSAIEAEVDALSNKIGILSGLNTTAKENLVSAVNELFTFANDGKTKWSSVIGSPLASSDTFTQMQSKTQTIKNTLATNLTAMGKTAAGTETLTELVNKVSISYSAGTSVAYKGGGSADTSSSSMIPYAESNVNMNFTGTARVEFRLISSGTNDAYAQIYKNGTPFGTLRTSPAGGANIVFTEDISVSSGDYIQIYFRTQSTSGTARIMDFFVKLNIAGAVTRR